MLRNSRALLLLLAAAGVAMRIREALDPLTFDEAWVAMSLQAETLGGALFYERVPQSSPPLWLALNYLYVKLANPGDLMLRLIPLASAAAMVWASAAYAGKVLGSRFRMPAAAMAAASSFMIVQSAQLKQYSSDALLATLGLWGVTACLKARDGRGWTVLAAAWAVSMTVAYTQALLLPVAVAAMMAAAWRGRISWSGTVARIAAVGGFGAVVLAVFIRGNTHPYMRIYWADQFPGSVEGAAGFFGLKALQWTRVLYRSSKFEEAVWAVMLALAVGGAAALVLRRRRSDGRVMAAGAFVATFVTLAAAAAVKMYPMGPARMVLFSFPVLLTVWLAGVDQAGRMAAGVMGRRAGRVVARTWPAVVAVALLVLMARDLARPGRGRPEVVDTPGMVEFLRERTQGNDTVWMHGSAVDMMEYYFARMGRPAGRIVGSGYGLPCCVTERLTVRGVSYAGEIVKEWDERVAGRELGRVWLVTLEEEMIPNGHDDGAELRARLVERGCRAAGRTAFRAARVDLLECGGAGEARRR